MHPVIAVRRIIKTPIAIVTDYDRMIMVSVMTPDPVARDIAAIIDVPEGWPRIIVERSVTTPIEGAR